MERGHDAKRLARLAECLAHDLKSPIAAIVSNAQFLLDEKDWTPESVAATTDIAGASDAMNSLLHDIEAVAAHADGKLVPDRGAMSLGELLGALEQQVAPVLREKQHRLEIRAPDGAMIRVDKQLVLRALSNLVENSARHAPAKTTIAIEVETSPGGEVEIRVRDRGPRVPEELRSELFGLYARTERERLPRASRGVALHVCQLVAEVHGGSLSVEDDGADGALFRLRLR